ncbi:MAG: cobalt ABC transporter substrate-binding protein [Noviherbaspirillum sp.]
MKQLFPTIALACAAVTIANPAAAHHVWIEQDAQGARLHFGEFGDNLREVSPGRLDKFVKPTATLVSARGAQPLTLNKTAEAFAFAGRAAQSESLLAEEALYPVIEKKDGDKVTRTVWTPAARYVTDFAVRVPQLTLDVVPTGTRGEFAVFYKGQPLADAKLEAVAQSGWSRALSTDKQGKLTLELPWQGAYAIEVKHSDRSGGERDGQKYDVASYVTTLTFSLAEGLPSPALPPKATPNK